MIELKMCLCYQGQAHSGGAGLGLYPILWPYSNGTSYSSSLSLAPTVKWVHPENPVIMNSEVSLRRVCLFFVSTKRKKLVYVE